MVSKLCKICLLCAIGGAGYCLIELLWRGYTHWSMFLVAAVITLPLNLIHERVRWNIPLPLQALMGGLGITLAELLAGLLLNVRLGLDVWDYSYLPMNLWGQICAPYSALWVVLAGFGIVLFDWLRWRLFGEEMPRYVWTPRK